MLTMPRSKDWMFRLKLRFSDKTKKMFLPKICAIFQNIQICLLTFSAMHPILLLCSIAFVSGSELSSPDGICRYHQTKCESIIFFFKQNNQVSSFKQNIQVCKYQGSWLSKWSKNWLVGLSGIGPGALDLLWLPKERKILIQNVCRTGIFNQNNTFGPIFLKK